MIRKKSKIYILSFLLLICILQAGFAYTPDVWEKGVRPDYSKIDSYVRECGSKCGKTPQEVAEKITAFAESDLEKARAVFDWLSFYISYDTTYSVYSAEGAFKNKKSVCQGYADLFTIMATHVGLDAWTVTGNAKDYFSSKGRKYNGTSGHAWNIVSLADREILVDSTWGAGYVNGNTFHRSFDDEWFDTHPAVFIFSHLPANTEYELLDTIIYEDEFWMLPFVNPILVKCGINPREIFHYFLTHPESNSFTVYSKFSFADDNGFKILEMPLSGKLLSKKEYTFRFKYFEPVKLENMIYKPDEDGIITIKKSFNGSGNLLFTDMKGQGLFKYDLVTEEVYSKYSYSKRKAKKDFLTSAKRLHKKYKDGILVVPVSEDDNLYVVVKKDSQGNFEYTSETDLSQARLLCNLNTLNPTFGQFYELQNDGSRVNKDPELLALRLPKKEEAERIFELISKENDEIKNIWYEKGASSNDDEICSDIRYFFPVINLSDTPDANYFLGSLYGSKNYIPNDFDKSFYYYRRSALQGSADGMSLLGVCYEHGIGTTQSLSEAKKWYQKSVEVNPVLHNNYYNLAKVSAKVGNYDEMIHWLKEGADAGNKNCAGDLSDCYRNGNYVDADEEKAFFYCERAWILGNYEVALTLSRDYLSRNENEKAFKVIEEATKKSSDMILWDELIWMYSNGIGCSENKFKAAEISEKLYKKGSHLAAARYASFLFFGQYKNRNLQSILDAVNFAMEDFSYYLGELTEYKESLQKTKEIVENLMKRLPEITANPDAFLKNIPVNIGIDAYTNKIFSYINNAESLFGDVLKDADFYQKFSSSDLDSKIFEPVNRLYQNEDLNGYSKILVVFLGTNTKSNKYADTIYNQKDFFTSKKMEMHKEWYRFDKSLSEYYDAIFILPGSNFHNSIKVLCSKLNPLSQMDIMTVNTSFTLSEETQRTFKSFYINSVEAGNFPRFYLLGDKTDSTQKLINMMFEKDTAEKICVFGTPYKMTGEIALGFRKDKMLMCLCTSSLGNGKSIRVYLDETGWRQGNSVDAMDFIFSDNDIKDIKSKKIGEGGHTAKPGKMVMVWTLVK